MNEAGLARTSLAAAVALAALAGCDTFNEFSAEPEILCSREDPTCPEGFYCNHTHGRCRRPVCQDECAADEECVDGVCVEWRGCEGRGDPGCLGCACEACVCELMPECCTQIWAQACVHRCGVCGACGRPDSRRCTGEACPDIDWVDIAGGEFTMGSAEPDAGASEWPIHRVTVAGFEMARTEVTVAQFARCVDAGVCPMPTEDLQCSWNVSGLDDAPVNCLDWYQAWVFAEWVGGRLPTEAEWEYAARNEGQAIKYPWGNEEATCDLAVMNDDNAGGSSCGGGDEPYPWAVCSRPAGNTEQGLCDMAGNVLEWVEDDWHETYDDAPTDGSAWVDEPRHKTYRCGRGGGMHSKANRLRVSYRQLGSTNQGHASVGFRPVR